MAAKKVAKIKRYRLDVASTYIQYIHTYIYIAHSAAMHACVWVSQRYKYNTQSVQYVASHRIGVRSLFGAKLHAAVINGF